jgi:hypothetical protein
MTPDQLNRRLERLARSFLRARAGFSPVFLWTGQAQLLDLQREIQRAIGSAKAQRQTNDSVQLLRALRSTRWNARRLGDSFAWTLLPESQWRAPLGANQRVPVAEDRDGNLGTLAIATELAKQGWGVPLLHDITDCLRIGDITFVFQQDDGGFGAHTVEVKTRSVGIQEHDDGTSSRQFQVTLVSPEAFGPQARTDPSGAWIPRANERERANPTPGGPRLERQLKRMANAFQRQRAEDRTFVDVAGQPTLHMAVNTQAGHHWKALRRVIRQARSSGYGCESVDDAALYLAFYDPQGTLADGLGAVVDDLKSSGILTQDPTRDALALFGIPSREASDPADYMPFFLYPIPKVAIADLLHGRMTIVVAYNFGRVFKALEAAGFEVEYAGGGPSLRFRSRLVDGDGVAYVAELGGLDRHITELVYEFKELSYIVEVALAMRSVAVDIAAGRLKHPAAGSGQPDPPPT